MSYRPPAQGRPISDGVHQPPPRPRSPTAATSPTPSQRLQAPSPTRWRASAYPPQTC